jgi:polar amino acid transport system permease protein
MTALGGLGPRDRGDVLEPPGRGRRSRRSGQGALRSTAIAFASTFVFFGFLAWVAVNSPGWPLVQQSFFNGALFADSLPDIAAAFWVNVQLFFIAEILILALALVIAVLRSIPGPVLFPLRLLSTVYVDVFRALPGVLIIYILGFHPSQSAAARSLGLSQWQALRYVVLPQAIRRVIPPLLNDFIGLQKDTVLVSYIGVVEIFRQSQITEAAHFNYTPYLATALVFLVMTIPLARFTDWLVARDRRRAAANR